jgi:hypothetical protein
MSRQQTINDVGNKRKPDILFICYHPQSVTVKLISSQRETYSIKRWKVHSTVANL